MTLTADETLTLVRRHPSSFLLHFLLGKDALPNLTAVIAGAYSPRIGEPFPAPSPLYWIPRSTVHAFEPHPDNLRKVQTPLQKFPCRLITHEMALGHASGSEMLYETIHPFFSSLCPPCPSAAQEFSGLEGLKLHRTLPVSVLTLDGFCSSNAVGRVSSLSIDTNGNELSVLAGAEETLTHVLHLSVRQLFPRLYDGQSEVWATARRLREAGWEFHHWRQNLAHRLADTEFHQVPQLISAEAVYFPRLDRLPMLSPVELLSLAALASVFEAIDLAEKCLAAYDHVQSTDWLREYRAAFANRFHARAGAVSGKNPAPADVSPAEIFLPLVDGVEILVPDSLQLLTPYVLREQGDWFEPELPWLRRVLQPGMRVLDVGANYGLYSLSLARAVGPTGKVWAVEPTPQLFLGLERSASHNGFSHLQVFQQALSLTEGEAAFFVSGQTESNSLLPAGGEAVCIRVQTSSLDQFARLNGISRVDFVKIDAEGEEINILEGGRGFFAENDPLVLAEIRHGRRFNGEIIGRLADLGYASYRLVPGLNLLTPFAVDSPADLCSLNILACKTTRAQVLQAAGLLSTAPETYQSLPFTESASDHYLACLPYGRVFATRTPADWVERFEGGEQYRQCLHAFSASLLPSIPPHERVGLLAFSFERLHALIQREATLPRLLSLARIAGAWGRQDVARNILTRLTSEILGGTEFRMLEPFLSPAADFDLVDPLPEPGWWCTAAILHEKIRISHLSTFFENPPPLPLLHRLESLGYLLPNMRRRLDVIRARMN